MTKSWTPKFWKTRPKDLRLLPGLNSWLQKYMALVIFSKRMFATNRAAIGRIRTRLLRSRAGPRGHILGPFPAPGGPKKVQKKTKNFLEKS